MSTSFLKFRDAIYRSAHHYVNGYEKPSVQSKFNVLVETKAAYLYTQADGINAVLMSLAKSTRPAAAKALRIMRDEQKKHKK